ncbi:hypothetical protein CERSUDRAFT_97888 [Gelatoporia subvermispora B]|uniref:Uncharacterized protein n=1 Tax=Ceriporiopsis subvermispora (strain B) TaxID=914234 RepID=M2QAK7_CERS8|nr:hypothetical protein CERSUDRAFT_97888 [Gelatoporia subvermispora B]
MSPATTPPQGAYVHHWLRLASASLWTSSTSSRSTQASSERSPRAVTSAMFRPFPKAATLPGVSDVVPDSAGLISALPDIAFKVQAEMYMLYGTRKMEETEHLQTGRLAGIKAACAKHFGYYLLAARGPSYVVDLEAAQWEARKLIVFEKPL